MSTNPAAASSHATPSSDGHRRYRTQQNVNEATDVLWTPEECLEAYQTSNDQYWQAHGLTMNHSGLPSYTPQSSAPSGSHFRSPAFPPSSHSGLQAGAPFYILPQDDYIAKRRYQRQAPIVFRASPAACYIRLSDFYSPPMQGNPPPLEGGDDTVFSGDNLSQKQSIRLEVRLLDIFYLVSHLLTYTRFTAASPTRGKSTSAILLTIRGP